MYTIQVEGTLMQIIQIFYRIGIWQSVESHFRRIVKKLFYAFFGALFPIFLTTNVFLCADRDESIFSVEIVIVAAVVYVKLLYLLFKKQELLAFLYDPVILHSIENREEYQQANDKIKKFVIFVRSYCLALFLTAVLLIVLKLPIFAADKGLPVLISFSWNDSEIIYWLAYVFVSLSFVLYVIINSITPLIWYMMLNYSIEYELLGNKLKRLGGVENKSIKTIAKNEVISRLPERSAYVEDFIVLMKAHCNLTETIERFRSCFSTLFLCQITTSGMGICVSVYNLAFSSKGNILQTQFYVAILLYGFFDIFLVMYLANEITIASGRLSYCLFESNWTEQTESCKKYVLIMGEVLKQSQQLVILIYPMNLETFMTIINGAYRMFNILKSF